MPSPEKSIFPVSDDGEDPSVRVFELYPDGTCIQSTMYSDDDDKPIVVMTTDKVVIWLKLYDPLNSFEMKGETSLWNDFLRQYFGYQGGDLSGRVFISPSNGTRDFEEDDENEIGDAIDAYQLKFKVRDMRLLSITTPPEHFWIHHKEPMQKL